MKGEVVGINAQIYSQSGGYEGLSFAIPIDIAANVEHQILERGHVTRGHLGVTVQDMTQGLADSFGFKKLEGVLVRGVEPGSPAAKARLEPGDVILKFNGQQINNSAQLPMQIAETKPGTAVKLELSRRCDQGVERYRGRATGHRGGRVGNRCAKPRTAWTTS